MQFIIDRKTWYRGKGGWSSKLLSSDGTRCCIGFVGKQCGIPDSCLLNRPTIERREDVSVGGQYSSQVLEPETNWPEWMRSSNDDPVLVGADIQTAYVLNDDEDITDEAREGFLTALFAKHGDELVFIN